MDLTTYLQFYKHLLTNKEKLLNLQTESIFTINYDELRKDTDLIIFDFDDTLVDHLGRLEDKTTKLLKDLEDRGFQVAVFSNCTGKRQSELDKILKPIHIYNVSRSDKPRPDGFIEAMEYHKITPERTTAVGDKIGTEIYGAYLANIKYRILLEPYSYIFGGRKAPFPLKILREFEKSLYFWKFPKENSN